jgi:hypothetical protein
MTDRSRKVTELPSLPNASGDDLLIIVDNPQTEPETKKITVTSFFNSVNTVASFSNSVTFNGTVRHYGNTVFSNNVTYSSIVSFNSNSNFSNTVSVSGSCNFYANVTSNGNVNFAGNTTFSNTAVFTATPPMKLTINYYEPPHSNSAGEKGQILISPTYLFVCVDNNNWKRVLLSDF